MTSLTETQVPWKQSASFIMSETVQILDGLKKSQLTSWITQTFFLLTWEQEGTF